MKNNKHRVGIITDVERLYNINHVISGDINTVYLQTDNLSGDIKKFVGTYDLFWEPTHVKSIHNVLGMCAELKDYGVTGLVLNLDYIEEEITVIQLILNNRVLPIFSKSGIDVYIKNGDKQGLNGLVMLPRLCDGLKTIIDTHYLQKRGIDIMEDVDSVDYKRFINRFDMVLLCGATKEGTKTMIGKENKDLHDLDTYSRLLRKFDGSIIYYGEAEDVVGINKYMIETA